MRVQTLRSEAPIECFDVSIVGWLPWPAEVERDTVGVRPKIQISGYELRSLIDTDCLWITRHGAGPL